MPALHHGGELVLHIVAQIVEAVFVVGAVGDVGGIGGAALVVVEPVQDDAHFEAEEAENLPHPFGVALGQIVVHGDDMDTLASQRVQIGGERRDEGLAFAGLHFGDVAVVEHHAADELHIVVALAQCALRGLADDGEGFGQEFVQRRAVGEARAEFGRLAPQRVVAERGHFRFEDVDRLDAGLVSLDPSVVGRAEKTLGEGAQACHQVKFLLRCAFDVRGRPSLVNRTAFAGRRRRRRESAEIRANGEPCAALVWPMRAAHYGAPKFGLVICA